MNNTDIASRWEKNMKHLQSGGFGPADQPQTLLLYWKAQELAGYPYASENVKYFEKMVENERNDGDKLKPCPFCGSEVEIKGGPENWTPTWYDPDSGGDPYYIDCKCGCHFSIGHQDAKDFINAWNRRRNDGT